MTLNTMQYVAKTERDEESFDTYREAYHYVLARRREGELAMIQTQQLHSDGWTDIAMRVWMQHEPSAFVNHYGS